MPTPRRPTTTAAPLPATGRRPSLRRSALWPCTWVASCPCSPVLLWRFTRPRRRSCPASAGTFRTDGPTFAVLLVGVISLTAGLMILPALTSRADRRMIDSLTCVRSFVHSSPSSRLTAIFGLAYPAIMVGFASLSFSAKAQGSLLYRNGTVVGSALAAQSFTSPRYFHERPSGTTPAYNAGATTFANLGPTNPALAKAIRQQAAAVLDLERPYNPGLTVGDIPVDAVTTSGSGIDPDISPAYAQLQARRIAAVRHLPLATRREADQAEHDRAQPRLARRAGRQRPDAQPCARQTWEASDGSKAFECLLARARAGGGARLLSQARPAPSGAQPGDVHGRARQPDHDRDLLLGPRARSHRQLWFVGVISFWLWLTVLFANFAEAMAEGRGKAQADVAARDPHDHRRPSAPGDGSLEEVPAPDLQPRRRGRRSRPARSCRPTAR